MVGAFTTTGSVFEDVLNENYSFMARLAAWFGGGLIWITAFVILLPASRGGFEIFTNKKYQSNLNRQLTFDEKSMTFQSKQKSYSFIHMSNFYFMVCTY